MDYQESELEMVRRHVANGRLLVDRQREILSELRAAQHPTETAERLLDEMKHVQALHEEHLRRIQPGSGTALSE